MGEMQTARTEAIRVWSSWLLLWVVWVISTTLGWVLAGLLTLGMALAFAIPDPDAVEAYLRSRCPDRLVLGGPAPQCQRRTVGCSGHDPGQCATLRRRQRWRPSDREQLRDYAQVGNSWGSNWWWVCWPMSMDHRAPQGEPDKWLDWADGSRLGDRVDDNPLGYRSHRSAFQRVAHRLGHGSHGTRGS
jgi:hypothetical protein